MRAPVNREQLRLRNAQDARDENAAAMERSPAEGMVAVVELSDVVRKLAIANTAEDAGYDLERKAWLYVRPLRAVLRT
jgi:hypothetical protein